MVGDIMKNEFVSLNDSTKAIRQAIRLLSKKHGVKPLSVRRDRGTAAGWINISGSNWGKLTKQEEEVLKEFGLVYGHGGVKTLISPDEHGYFYKVALDLLENKDKTKIYSVIVLDCGILTNYKAYRNKQEAEKFYDKMIEEYHGNPEELDVMITHDVLN